MKANALAGLALAGLLTLPALAADEVNVYKWTDQEGVPHFTDRPPSSADAQFTGIRSRRTDPASVQARVGRENQAADEAGTRRDEGDETREQAAEQRRETLAQREANCQQARERLETYETARRLYKPLPSGEREYLSDEELTQARVEARQAVKDWCD